MWKTRFSLVSSRFLGGRRVPCRVKKRWIGVEKSRGIRSLFNACDSLFTSLFFSPPVQNAILGFSVEKSSVGGIKKRLFFCSRSVFHRETIRGFHNPQALEIRPFFDFFQQRRQGFPTVLYRFSTFVEKSVENFKKQAKRQWKTVEIG